MNAAAVAGATLGERHGAARRAAARRAGCADFLAASHALVALLRVQGAHLTASLVRNEASDFREGLAWLESGGLVERLVDGDGVVLHVPTEKRMNLDFYKNNTIHFFLLPALLTRALLRGRAARAGCASTSRWWLDLYRWEFPLPEREALAASSTRWLAYYREAGALVGDVVDREHIVDPGDGRHPRELPRGVPGRGADAWRRSRSGRSSSRTLIQRMRREFATSLLLGEAHKPEGSSMVTFGNALSRLAELRHVAEARAPRQPRPLDRARAGVRPAARAVRQLRS